VDYVLKYMYI